MNQDGVTSTQEVRLRERFHLLHKYKYKCASAARRAFGTKFYFLKQSRKVPCQMHFQRAIDRWMETVSVRPMVCAGPPRISQECSRSQRFFLLNPEAQFREVVDKLGMLVCPSRPKKFGRAQVSGHLGKIAQITPGFL